MYRKKTKYDGKMASNKTKYGALKMGVDAEKMGKDIANKTKKRFK